MINYDRKITILQPVPVKQPSGQEIPTLQPIATNPDVWASKADRSGISQQEQQEAAQPTAKGYTVFKLRYRADLSRTYVIECEGVRYDIQSINEIGRRRETMIFTYQKEQ